MKQKGTHKLEPNLSRIFTDKLIESANAMIIGLNKEGKINLFNPAAESISGYKLEELQNKDWFEILVPREKYPVAYQEFNRLMSGGLPKNFQNPILTKSGKERFISWTNSEVRQGDIIVGLISFGIDITDQKKAEEEKDQLFNLSLDLIGIAGFDGYFKQLNPSWELVLGYSLDELMAKPFIDFIHPDDLDSTRAEMEKLAAGQQTINFENRYLHKDGSVRHISWTATPLPEESLLYCIGRDITERKNTENKILESQQRLKDLASELILTEEKHRREIAKDLHDHVGQLLASSRFQLAALKKSINDDELKQKLDKVSEILLLAVQDTRNIISDLSLPQLNELGLHAAIEDWVDEHLHIKHGLEVEFNSTRKKYQLDEKVRTLVFRSVREILTNITKHAKAEKVSLEMIEKNNLLQITIKDDGQGFDYTSEQLRSANKGGLGLFSIQERMQDIGGVLEIISVKGKGTKVILSVPLHNDKQ